MIQSGVRLLGRYSHINWALADQAMVSGVNFLTSILLARFLGIEEFGRFVLAWLAVLFINSLQHAIINSPMMSIGPKQAKKEIPSYYGAIVTQQVIFSFTAALLLYGGVILSGIVFPEWGVEGLALPLTIASLAFHTQDFLRRYFFTRGRASVAFAIDAIRYLGQFVVLICLFKFSPEIMDATNALWVISLTAIVAATTGAFFFERIDFNTLSLRAITGRHWNFSKWLTASALMQWTTVNLFLIGAGVLLGAASVGALKAAQNILGITHIFFQGLENIVPARAASQLHQHGTQALSKYLKKVAIFGGMATAAVGMVASLFPEYWLQLFFGPEYSGNGYLIRWYAVVYLATFFSFSIQAGILALEKSKVIFKSYVYMTLFSIVAVLPLTSQLGLTGVMTGILTVNLVQAFTLWIGFQKNYKLVEVSENRINDKVLQTASANEYLEKNSSVVLSDFFKYLDNNNIDHCVIGRTDGLPGEIVGDIDIIIKPEKLENFSNNIYDFSLQNNLQVVQIFHHEQTAYYFVLAWMNKDGKVEFLHLDMSSHFFQNGRMFLTAGEALSARTPAIDQSGNRKGFDVFIPGIEFVYYLFKKVDKQYLNDEHGKHLSKVWVKDPDDCREKTRRFWSEPFSSMLCNAANTESWEEVRNNLPALEKSVLSNLPRRSLGSRGREFLRILKRVAQPTGLHVVILGSDGSGKSSVIGRVLSELDPAFRRTFSFHLRPKFGLKETEDRPVVNPHEKAPRSTLASIFKVFYFWFDYMAGWLADVRPKTVRSTLVLFDRYFHDMQVDPKRYRYGGPMWLARFIGKIIPKPDLWILLDAPPEVLQERKQEVPFAETARQRDEYLKLVKDLKGGFIVDASQNLDSVVSDVNAIILKHMAERMEGRNAR